MWDKGSILRQIHRLWCGRRDTGIQRKGLVECAWGWQLKHYYYYCLSEPQTIWGLVEEGERCPFQNAPCHSLCWPISPSSSFLSFIYNLFSVRFSWPGLTYSTLPPLYFFFFHFIWSTTLSFFSTILLSWPLPLVLQLLLFFLLLFQAQESHYIEKCKRIICVGCKNLIWKYRMNQVFYKTFNCSSYMFLFIAFTPSVWVRGP